MGARPKIDDVDVKILRVLLKDPRTSFTEIAKDCEMSTNAVRIRFEKLKKAGVITGAIMQVDPKSLGYNCIANLLIQADINEETSVYDFLEKTPNIILPVQLVGRYNILSIGAFRSVDELAHTVEHVRSHPHVSTVEPGVWVDVVWIDHPKNLILEPFDGLSYTTELLPKDDNSKPTITHPQVASELAKENHSKASYELDKIDLQISKILSDNARMSFRKIAKKLGISTKTVIKRYKRLRKDVAPFSSITLDLRKIGYVGNALFLIKVSPQHKMSKVFDELLRIPNVVVAIRILGNIDIFAITPIANLGQLFKMKQGISKTPGITQIELLLDKPFPIWPLNLFSKLLPKQPQTT